MHMPTKLQVQKVIDILTKVLPKAEKEVNHLAMGNGSICGTIHCHGGWYFVASHPRLSKRYPLSYYYNDGANLIAKDLGFKNEFCLVTWAEKNPKIWGNKNGRKMFYSIFAFKSEIRIKGANTLRDIVEHWKEVQARLPK